MVKFLINEHNKKLWLYVIVCGALLGLFYQSMVVPDHVKNCFMEFMRYKCLDLNRKVTEFLVDFPIEDTYLLRLKGGLNEGNQPVEVLINGNPLEDYPSRRKQVRGTVYRIIPSRFVQRGENTLTIVCNKKPSYKLGIWLRNYREKLSVRNIFLLFDSSTHLLAHLEKARIIRGSLIGCLLTSSIWLLISHGSISLLCLSRKKIYSYSLFAVLPSVVVFTIFYLVSIYSPYYLIVTRTLFWSYVVLLSAVLYLSMISYKLWLKYKSTKDAKLFKQESLNQKALSAIVWVESRELLDKLILLFMLLLVFCALWLVLRIKIFADFFGSLAYLLLAAVVFIKLSRFLKEEQHKGEGDRT